MWVVLFFAGLAALAAAFIERRLPRPSRKVSAFLLGATAIYLCFELAFNARLLDVTGRPGEDAAIGGIEQWGRMISGFAVALGFWGLLAQLAARGGWETAMLSVAMFLSAVVIVPTVYWAEKAIVESGADRATLGERQIASLSVVVTRYLYRYRHLQGLPLSGDTLETPEGKAFYALFPSVYGSVLSNAGNALSIAEPAVRDAVRRSMGTSNSTYRDSYIAALREAQDAYNNSYLPAARAYTYTINAAPNRSAEAWNTYVASLADRGFTPDNVPARAREEVRERVRAMGAPVADYWPPWDRFGFEWAVQNQIFDQAQSEWSNRASALIAGGAPPTISSFVEFLDVAGVQYRLRQNPILARCTTDHISNRWSLSTWATNCHRPALEAETQAFLAALTQDAQSFAPGGDHYCAGANAIRALRVPWFALTVSMAGAFYHMSKVIWYLCYLSPWFAGWAWRWIIRVGFIAALVGAPLQAGHHHAIVGTRAYEALLAHKQHAEGWMRARLFDWIIRAEQMYYPFGHRLHRLVARSFSFAPPFALAARCRQALRVQAGAPPPPAAYFEPGDRQALPHYWLEGAWEGKHSPYGSSLERLSVQFFTAADGRLVGFVTYPDTLVACSGQWIQPNAGDGADYGSWRFRESIDRGGCLQNGQIDIQRIGESQIAFSWTRFENGQMLSTGVLDRRW